MNLKQFFAELKRRNVYRACVGYAAAAWLIIQICTQVFPFFEIPAWSIRLIILLLATGFPCALVWAWIFEFTSEGIMRTDDVPPESPIVRSAGRKLDFIIIAILALAVTALLFDRVRARNRPATGEIPDKSIAVLPFENLSEDQENGFFADGIQDDLLTNLAKIKDLKVISRTSVMRYRSRSERNIKEIAQSLGVANILEGSVRRVGDRVAVNVQLIDARTDHHLWANKYDRTLADSLGLEGELATEIAENLRAKLTPEEKDRVARKPTDNPDAYVLYLRALPYEQGPDTLLQDYKRAEQLYTQAILLDPNFALAHARLGSTYAEIYHFHEPLKSWETKAKAEAEMALRLQPNLAEGHFALGLCILWMDADYERALAEFNLAQQLSPNDANVGALIAAVQRRQGHWQECLESYERIARVDPQNPNVVRNLVFTNTALRRWPEAAQAAERLRMLAPDSVVAKVQAGYVEFMWKGDDTLLKSMLAQIPADNDPDGLVTGCRWDAAMIDRNFAAADEALQNTSLEAVDYLNGGQTPKHFLAGCTELTRNDQTAAATAFENARPILEANVAAAPESAERHANLGLLYAFMGRKEDAIREGRKAVELKPVTKDALDGSIMEACFALILARVGENEEALTLLERLLPMPGPVDSVFYSITRSDLQKRWVWDPLRGEARFQRLVTTPP